MDTQGSGLLERGALGMARATSTEGRYLRTLERRLLKALRSPTPPQRLLVSNLCRLAWQLEKLQDELLRKERAQVDELRTYASLHHAYLGCFRELFSRPSRTTPPDAGSAAEALRAIHEHLE